MAYSNGYNSTTVLAALFGRLAWTDSNLNTANTTSVSGRKFDDGSFHAVVNTDNVRATAKDQTDWNTYFTTKQNAVISRCLNTVFSENEFKGQSLIYDRYGEQEELVTNNGLAVGYRIKVARSFDLSVKLASLDLYFNEAKTFNVYLFKQGSTAALQTKSVTTVANRKTTVALTDWILNYRESEVYYVVYFQDDLGTAQAIREQACMNRVNLFYAEPFNAEVLTGLEFDREQLLLTNQPSGMNMVAVCFRDFTQNVLNQPYLFDELIGLTMAVQVMEDIIYSLRSNMNERELKQSLDRIGLQLDLNGAAPITDGPKLLGLRERMNRELKRVKESFYPKPKAQTVSIC